MSPYSRLTTLPDRAAMTSTRTTTYGRGGNGGGRWIVAIGGTARIGHPPSNCLRRAAAAQLPPLKDPLGQLSPASTLLTAAGGGTVAPGGKRRLIEGGGGMSMTGDRLARGTTHVGWVCVVGPLWLVLECCWPEPPTRAACSAIRLTSIALDRRPRSNPSDYRTARCFFRAATTHLTTSISAHL